MTCEDKWLTIAPGTRVASLKWIVIKLVESPEHNIGHFHAAMIGGPRNGEIVHLTELVDVREPFTNQFGWEE